MKKYNLNDIKKELKRIGVNTIYLFGSRARNQEGPLSDYDFGILLKKKIQSSCGIPKYSCP